ncbi:hypothetical protein N9P26_03595 [Amylibacter sp.]|nr:hypothetical protein [Amylibacter sp.]
MASSVTRFSAIATSIVPVDLRLLLVAPLPLPNKWRIDVGILTSTTHTFRINLRFGLG